MSRLLAVFVTLHFFSSIAYAASVPTTVLADFYKAYIDAPAAKSATMQPPFSRSFKAAIAHNEQICSQYAGTDICGWSANGDAYLDAQEIDPALTYATSGIRFESLEDDRIQVSFNVYPSQKEHKAYYQRTLVYYMMHEDGQWVVNDIARVYPGKPPLSGRAAMKDENDYYAAQAH